MTEREAIQYLLDTDERFLLPTKETRKQIIDILGLDARYSRTFDMFLLKGWTNYHSEVEFDDPKDITLIELKTTQKYLPQNPKGFFFGATQNEFDVAKQLGEQYKFCFVSLHPDSRSHVLVTGKELEERIRTKRTQYQINL